jgi:hypothetical protein
LVEGKEPDLQEYETELIHWRQQYDSEELGRNEAPARALVVLDSLKPKIEEAESLLQQLKDSEELQELDLLRMKELIRDVRDTFKRLDKGLASGGPPLE